MPRILTRRVRAVAGPGLCILGLVPSFPAMAQEYHVDRTAERRVTFTSSTSINDFDGVTERVDGYVLLDGQGLREVADEGIGELYFEVDLASLDTGISLRDRHMREDYLETDRHPWATFQGEVRDLRPQGDGSFFVTAAGQFGVHGVTRDRRIECELGPEEAGRRGLTCQFPVDLADHDIEIPRVMFLKLAPEVSVTVSFHLVRVAGG